MLRIVLELWNTCAFDINLFMNHSSAPMSMVFLLFTLYKSLMLFFFFLLWPKRAHNAGTASRPEAARGLLTCDSLFLQPLLVLSLRGRLRHRWCAHTLRTSSIEHNFQFLFQLSSYTTNVEYMLRLYGFSCLSHAKTQNLFEKIPSLFQPNTQQRAIRSFTIFALFLWNGFCVLLLHLSIAAALYAMLAQMEAP